LRYLFTEACGASWALLHFLKAVEHDLLMWFREKELPAVLFTADSTVNWRATQELYGVPLFSTAGLLVYWRIFFW